MPRNSRSLVVCDVGASSELYQRLKMTTNPIRLFTHGCLFADGMRCDYDICGPTGTKKGEYGSEGRRQLARGCISPSSIISPESPPSAGGGESCSTP